MMELNERVAVLESRSKEAQDEIIRLRDGHQEFRENVSVIATQLGQIAVQVTALASTVELVAERAAHKVLAAYLATQASDTDTTAAHISSNLTKICLAALALVAAAFGIKAAGLPNF